MLNQLIHAVSILTSGNHQISMDTLNN